MFELGRGETEKISIINALSVGIGSCSRVGLGRPLLSRMHIKGETSEKAHRKCDGVRSGHIHGLDPLDDFL